MKIQTIRKLYGKRPFQPFVLHLANGTKIAIEHPEFMATAPNGRELVVYESDNSFHIIDLMLVNEVTVNEKRLQKSDKA